MDVDITYSLDEKLNWLQDGSGFGMGCVAEIHLGSGNISVACFTDNWGAQGDFEAAVVGTPSNLPGWHVVVYTPSAYAASMSGLTALGDHLQEFVSFVTVESHVESATPVSESALNAQAAESDTTHDEGESPDTAHADFESIFESIKAARSGDVRMGGTTMEMNEAGSYYVGQFDELMSDVLSYLKTLPSVDQASLAASQQAWQAELDCRLEVVRDEYAGGSLIGPALAGERMQMQEDRIAELIAMVG